jgi:hypothetical protein
MDQPKKTNYTSKWGRVFLIYCFLNFVGLFIVLVLFPDFIGEEERTIVDYIPFKLVFILWILFAILIGIGQTKQSPFFEPEWFRDSRVMKIFTSILAVPSFSFIFSISSVLVIYSLINYSFINEEIVLEGKLYQKEISESTGHRSIRKRKHYYVYFNEKKKYCVKVTESAFDDLKEGDIVELQVLKGRLDGFYFSDSINYKRYVQQSNETEVINNPK